MAIRGLLSPNGDESSQRRGEDVSSRLDEDVSRRRGEDVSRRREIPDDLWTRCTQCRHLMYTRDFARDLKVCSRCGYHFRLTAFERLDVTVDLDSFVEFDAGLEAENPLGFPEYPEKLARSQKATAMKDAMLTGEACLEGHHVVMAVSNFHFQGGSMGSVVGEKVTRLFERAIEHSLPAIVISSSGGARMQEGSLSLMQMAKTSAAAGRLAKAGLPYLVVLTDPSTAGVQASYASLGDVIIAEPGAYIGFTGARVIEQALRIKLPRDFQSAEFQLEHGMVDMVKPRKEIRETLVRLLGFFGG